MCYNHNNTSHNTLTKGLEEELVFVPFLRCLWWRQNGVFYFENEPDVVLFQCVTSCLLCAEFS